MAKKKNIYHVGLVDADLLCNGTRHPNLALLKIAGYFRDNGFVLKSNAVSTEVQSTYELLTNVDNFEELLDLDYIFVSCVFTFTIDKAMANEKNVPLLNFLLKNKKILRKKMLWGGTGTYANLSEDDGFVEARDKDMHLLEKDKFLLKFKSKSGEHGINMCSQMPDYHLYDEYVGIMETLKKSDVYKDYKKYSIGFLTRGCFRQCSFCVNKLEKKAVPYSKLADFLDNERDENGKLIRPYIYLWDDNFLSSPYWEKLLDELIATGRPFQFRQGLDERILATSRRGEDMARKLASSKYHGDFIFAFDNWEDREVIEKALKVWKRYNPNKGTKFYLFCGFKQEPSNKALFLDDIRKLFWRIKILMSYGCVGYVMRHEDYHKSPISNFYVQIARWCNQQAFYKKMSFWEFCYRNQTYWEQNLPDPIIRRQLASFEEFEQDIQNGYYDNVKMCLPLKTIVQILDMFPEHREELIEMFNYKMTQLKNPKLWE